jgi:carboxyl-terminal processing protease
VKRRTSLINRSADQILITANASILSNFFGEEAFYPVYMSKDPVIAAAVEAIQKGDAHPQAVAAMRYKKSQ